MSPRVQAMSDLKQKNKFVFGLIMKFFNFFLNIIFNKLNSKNIRTKQYLAHAVYERLH